MKNATTVQYILENIHELWSQLFPFLLFPFSSSHTSSFPTIFCVNTLSFSAEKQLLCRYNREIKLVKTDHCRHIHNFSLGDSTNVRDKLGDEDGIGRGQLTPLIFSHFLISLPLIISRVLTSFPFVCHHFVLSSVLYKHLPMVRLSLTTVTF